MIDSSPQNEAEGGAVNLELAAMAALLTSSLGGGQHPNSRSICLGRRAEVLPGNGCDSDRAARHVEKLDTVTVFHFIRAVPLHNRAYVAGAQTLIG